jgi:hypothetical protein
MIKSNEFKQTMYPDGFSDDDKLEYDTLYAQAKLIHNDVERENPFIIHTAIIGYIRAKKGMGETFTDEELLKVKESYKLESKVIECKEPEDSYLYDKDNNPIYFPSKLEITCDEKKDKVILEA